jgi:hypothetical protein
MSKPRVEVGIDQIWVKPGEVLTVWLGEFGGDGREQVELRVLPSGKMEVFMNDENKVQVKNFMEWEPMGS